MIIENKDRRSRKVQLLDFFLLQACKSSYVKNKLRVLSDRMNNAIIGYKFSYISSENGEAEFIKCLLTLYDSSTFVFFDVGAHHGTYSEMVLACTHPSGYAGYLFEPTPASFAVLKGCHGQNDLLHLNNIALSNFNGAASLLTYPDSPTRNGLLGVGAELKFQTREISCDVMRGDDYCKKNQVGNIHLLKIDAEGHDFFVIEGFLNLIENRKIDVIQFEYTFKHADMRIPLSQYYDFFLQYGYKIGPLRKYGVDFYDAFDPRFNEYSNGPNYVAVRSDIVEKLRSFNGDR